jgi:hypothetical protein
MEVVIKYLAFIIIASFLVLFFFWGLSEMTIGYEPKQEIPDIIDDSNMFAPKPTSICDCYYRAAEGSLAPAFQGTGCNILTIDNIAKNEIPECTFEAVE